MYQSLGIKACPIALLSKARDYFWGFLAVVSVYGRVLKCAIMNHVDSVTHSCAY